MSVGKKKLEDYSPKELQEALALSIKREKKEYEEVKASLPKSIINEALRIRGILMKGFRVSIPQTKLRISYVLGIFSGKSVEAYCGDLELAPKASKLDAIIAGNLSRQGISDLFYSPAIQKEVRGVQNIHQKRVDAFADKLYAWADKKNVSKSQAEKAVRSIMLEGDVEGGHLTILF